MRRLTAWCSRQALAALPQARDVGIAPPPFLMSSVVAMYAMIVMRPARGGHRGPRSGRLRSWASL